MNIAYETGKVDFVNCGAWSQKAMGEASKYADVHVCATFDKAVIHPSEWKYRPDSSYIHICLNETMTGIEFLFDPELPEGAPVLVGDATSTLFSRPVDISKYGMIYASAGKNFGRNYGYNSSVIYVFVFLSLSGIYIYIYISIRCSFRYINLYKDVCTLFKHSFISISYRYYTVDMYLLYCY